MNSHSHSGQHSNSPSPTSICIWILTVCVVGAVATALRPVLTPLLIGLMLFVLVHPVVKQLDDRHLPRWLTYILLCIVGAVGLGGIGWLIQIQGEELQQQLPRYQQRGKELLDRYARLLNLTSVDGQPDGRTYTLSDVLPVSEDEIVKYLLVASVELLELTAMAFFYLLFALMEAGRFSDRIRRNLSEDSRSQLVTVSDSIKTEMRRYLWIKTAISIAMGLTTAVLGWMFQLDFWLLWGILMFLANYVTYIGSIIALVPPILIAFVQFESTEAAGALAALLIASRVAWIDLAEMRYSGKHVNVSPVVVLLSVAFFGWMWGVVGMLLAVPLITIVHIILGSFDRTEVLAKLMSETGV